MTNYVYLGWGTTDSNGIAKLDHDADGEPIDHSYTGSGVGEVDVVASLDNPIVSGSVVSQPSSVWDCIFYDDGIVNPNTNWDRVACDRSEESNGTKFLCTQSVATSRASMNPLDNSSAFDFDAIPMAWEFDVVEWIGTGSCQAQLYQTTPTALNKTFNIHTRSPNGKSFKIVYTGTKLELWVDGVHQSGDITVTYDTNNKIRVGFAFSTKDDYMIVKNVKAYSI